MAKDFHDNLVKRIIKKAKQNVRHADILET